MKMKNKIIGLLPGIAGVTLIIACVWKSLEQEKTGTQIIGSAAEPTSILVASPVNDNYILYVIVTIIIIIVAAFILYLRFKKRH